MDDGDAVRAAPEDDAIARAIASVPGVAEASISRPSGGARSRLTLRLHPGEDDQRVAWAVAATLRERFDIDLDPEAIRPRMTAVAGSGDPAAPGPEYDPVAVVQTAGTDAPDGSPVDGGDAGGHADDAGGYAGMTGADHDAGGHAGSNVDGDGPVDHPRDRTRTGQVPRPPRTRPWTAREPLDPPDDDPSPAPPSAGDAGPPPGRPIELNTTRERLSRAVEDALAGLAADPTDDEPDTGDTDDAAEPDAGDTDDAVEAAIVAEAPAPAPVTDADPATPSASTATSLVATSSTAVPGPDVATSRPPRAVIEHLEVRRGTDTVEVTVTLRHETHTASGTARAVSTSKGRMRATAEATVAAMHALVRTALVVGVDRIVLTDAGDDVTVSVVLTMVTAGDEQRLLGGAIVRDDTDAEGAVVRATLDALNRRVIPLLANR